MNSNKKKVFIIQNTELGSHLPLSIYLTELLQSSVLLKIFEASLIISKSKSIPDQIVNHTNIIYQLNTDLYSIKNNIKFTLKAFNILRKSNKDEKINIIHCLYPNSSLLSAVLFKIFINKKVKIVYDVRSPWVEMSFARKHIKNKLSPLIKVIIHFEERILSKWVDYFIFITNGLKGYYQKKYKLNKINFSIIPSGVNTNIFKYSNNNILSKYGIKKDDKVLGIVSTLGKERDYSFIINSFKKLKGNNYKLVIIGDGPDKDNLELLSRKLSLYNRVIFTGKIPHIDIPKYISNFNFGICHLPDIFVFKNSFPLKILEYLSCGIPVLASNIKTHQEISKVLENVYIYDHEEDFIRLIKNNNFDRESNKNQILLNNKYDWEALNKRYVEIFRKY